MVRLLDFDGVAVDRLERLDDSTRRVLLATAVERRALPGVLACRCQGRGLSLVLADNTKRATHLEEVNGPASHATWLQCAARDSNPGPAD